MRGAELGCGTGVISLLISSRKKCRHVYAIEVQKEFAELTERKLSEQKSSNPFEMINIIKSGQ